VLGSPVVGAGVSVSSWVGVGVMVANITGVGVVLERSVAFEGSTLITNPIVILSTMIRLSM